MAIIAGLGADLIFTGYRISDASTVFYGSLTAALTLLNLSIPFGAITVLIGMALVRQAGERLLDKGLLWRRLIIGPQCLVISAALCLGATHILSKRVIVKDETIRQRSLFQTKELRWKDVRSMNGNFVPGGRLGLKGRSRHAWAAFVTKDGETVYSSLRFIRAVHEIQDVIVERTGRLVYLEKTMEDPQTIISPYSADVLPRG